MKIIHCADLHLGSKMNSLLSSDKAKVRQNELLFSFEEMVSNAQKTDVKVILISGDLFDSVYVNISLKESVKKIIKNAKGIDFLYLCGNHDQENIMKDLEDLDNFKTFDDDWTYYKYDNVVIAGVQLHSNNKSIYDTLLLNENDINIVALHGQISKYDLKNDAEIINLTKLKNKNIDYLALGHIHSFDTDKLDDRGIWCYSGCLEGRGFDECGKKGFVVLESKENKLVHVFVNQSIRTLHEIEFDITNKDDWFDIENDIIETLSSISKEDLIKLVIKGKFNLDLMKQIRHLDLKLNNIYFFVKIKDESSLAINIKDFEKDLSLKGEFIRSVLSSHLSDEEKNRVILVGIKALSGEDL